MSDPAYHFAELRRRFTALLLRGHIKALQSGRVIVTVSTASGDLSSPALPVLGRAVERVSIGELCLVICPQGQLQQGLVVMMNADPLLELLQQQITAINDRLA